jgi:hypothetical protein
VLPQIKMWNWGWSNVGSVPQKLFADIYWHELSHCFLVEFTPEIFPSILDTPCIGTLLHGLSCLINVWNLIILYDVSFIRHKICKKNLMTKIKLRIQASYPSEIFNNNPCHILLMPKYLSVFIYVCVLHIASLDCVWYPEFYYFAKRATHPAHLCFLHLIVLAVVVKLA